MNVSSVRRVAVRRALLAFVAVFVAQTVWILAVPPFRGSDEIDHVYRAVGVASGQWHLSHRAESGDLFVWVPTDVERAAHAQCMSLMYAVEADCSPTAQRGRDSLMTTSAGAYDPTYYFVVGNLAKPFHGSGVDYAIRAVTALMCALLIALGVGILTVAGAGRWTMLGVLTALTPEVIFSTAIAAPNGPEMALAFVLWASLLAAMGQISGSSAQRRLIAIAGAAAIPLTFVRMLGPLWVVMIVGAIVVTFGVSRTRDIVKSNPVTIASVSGAVFLGVCWWYAWRHIASQITGGSVVPVVAQWQRAFDVPLFTMQMVGAFPYREIPAPVWVYPLYLFVVGLVLVLALRHVEGIRFRRAVIGLGLATLVTPVVLNLAFLNVVGNIWQGRYLFPFVIGILPMCGLALDRAGFAPKEGARLMAVCALFLVVSQVACPYHVQRLELHRSASALDPSWWHAPWPVLVGLMLLACGIAAMLVREPARVPAPEAREPIRT